MTKLLTQSLIIKSQQIIIKTKLLTVCQEICFTCIAGDADQPKEQVEDIEAEDQS